VDSGDFVVTSRTTLTCRLGAGIALLSLTACGWVDATGNKQTALPPLVDSSVVVLNDGESFEINENTQRSFVFNQSVSGLTNWNWKLLDGQANIQHCQQFDEFELPNANNTLSQSCATDGSCEIKVEEQIVDNVTHFNITTPQMRAPAALEIQFTARDIRGWQVQRHQLLCAIPINEAPEAVDDHLTVTQGSYLSVSGSDELSLLANDNDDDDVRNLGLEINTTPVIEPNFAANFQLFSDGGFIYEPLANAPLSTNGTISDRFMYSVTDGTNSDTASVSIEIIQANTAPIQSIEIPELQATIWPWGFENTFIDFNNYFNDAENQALSFSELGSSMPESGNIYLTPEGQLKGNPTSSDSGRYFVSILVSDSVASVQASFYLNIVRGYGYNSAPYAYNIDNRIFTGKFNYDVSGFFVDLDQDHLSFTATGLPEDVTINSNGVISGISSQRSRGKAIIQVTANDGNGGTASNSFRLKID